MSDRANIERVLRHWFDDGPDSMPDRVADVVAARIAVNRQRRMVHLLGRTAPMNRVFTFITAAAATVILAVAAWQLLPGLQTGVGTPATPPPSPTPTAPVASSTQGADWWRIGTVGPCGSAPVTHGCAGPLAAGTYTSGGFQPAVTYTVPAGWVNVRDWANYFTIFPDTPANRESIAARGEPANDILVRSVTEPFEACDGETPSPDAPAALKLALGIGLRGLFAGTQVTTFAGREAYALTVSVRPDFPLACLDPGTSSPTPDGGTYTVLVVDLEAGGLIVVTIESQRAADHDAFLEAAMPVAETFQFGDAQ